jgi:capsular polysaccharide biosynthesis protein
MGIPQPASGSRLAAAAILVALIAGVISGTAAWVIASSRSAVYSATAEIEVDQPAAILGGTSDTVIKLSALRLKYAPLVDTDAVLMPAATALGVPEGSMRGRVSAGVPPNSLLIPITASTGSGSEAVRFANAAADALGQHANREQDELGVPVASRYTLTTIAPARAARHVSPTHRSEATAAVIVGVIVALTGFGVVTFLSRRVGHGPGPHSRLVS